LTAAVIAALGLSACGRNGPLELPPGPAGQPPPAAAVSSPSAALLPTASSTAETYAAPGTPQDTAAKTGFDAQGNPVAARGPKRPFVLDPLLQ